MSQTETNLDNEIPNQESSVATAPILDPATIESPDDRGLNLLTDLPKCEVAPPRSRRTSAAGVKETAPSRFAILKTRKSRVLLTLASLLVIGGLIALNTNRSSSVADGESEVADGLDLSELSDSTAASNPPKPPPEPRRHQFESLNEPHPLLKTAASLRAGAASGNTLRPDDSESARGVVPAANFTAETRSAKTNHSRRTTPTGQSGAWLTGEIEPATSTDSESPRAIVVKPSSAPRQLPTKPRHPLLD